MNFLSLTADGGPDAPAGNSLDMGMEIQAVSVTLKGDYDAGQCDADLVRRIWENIDGLANMYAWQCLLSF